MNEPINSWAGLAVAGDCDRFSLSALMALAAIETARQYPIASETVSEESPATVAPISGATVPAR